MVCTTGRVSARARARVDLSLTNFLGADEKSFDFFAVRFAVAVRTCTLSRLLRNGHMLVAQIAYLNLTHAAKARVDRLLGHGMSN